MDSQSSKNFETNNLRGEELLDEIVELLNEQNSYLYDIKKHTGCVYAYLILSLLAGLCVLIFYFFVIKSIF